MKPVILMLAAISMSFAYLPKSEFWSALQGTWQYSWYAGGYGGLPPQYVPYNSKVRFFELTPSDSIRYIRYFNDVPKDTGITPLYLMRNIFKDTTWAMNVCVYDSDTSLRCFGQSNVMTMTDTSFELSMPVLDGLGFGFKRAAVSVEQNPVHADLAITAGPNPFTDRVRLDFGPKLPGEVRIFDVRGRSVARFHRPGAAVAWDAAGLPAGVYMLQAVRGDNSFVKKLLLQR